MGMFLEKSRLSIYNLWFIVEEKTNLKSRLTFFRTKTISIFIRFHSIFFSSFASVSFSCVVIIKTLRDRIIMTFWSEQVISHQSFCERSASNGFNQIQYIGQIQCWKKRKKPHLWLTKFQIQFQFQFHSFKLQCWT